MGNKTIALIPARSGSKRVKNKNINKLKEHPLIAYTIQSASDSNLFDEIIVSTDSEDIKEIAEYYGANVPFMRPKEYAEDPSPDIEWVKHSLDYLKDKKFTYHKLSKLILNAGYKNFKMTYQINFLKQYYDSYLCLNISALYLTKKMMKLRKY